MYLADYHLHSSCSPDGHLTMAEVARTALERGLNEICITDHLDTIYWETYEPRTDFDWPESLRQLTQARALYGDRLTIRHGAELGEAILSFDRAETLLKNAPPLDFILGSVHTAGEAFDFLDLYYINRRHPDYEPILRDYIRQNCKLLEWGRFHVLAHFTLPLRYIYHHTGLRLSFDPYMDEVEQVLRLLIDKGIGLELNTNRGEGPLPGEKILRRYRELGGELVTIGSDAHTAADIGKAVIPCRELLEQCGFRYFATFEQGRPIFRPLS